MSPIGISIACRNLFKIYKIVNSITEDVFVGSTSQPLNKRVHIYNVDASSGKSFVLFDLMRHLGKDKFRIESLEEFP